MARTRNLKPGFFKNEDLAECDMAARLLFAGLWTIADREGRLEDRPKRIKAELLPYDALDADALLCQLAARGFIVRYVAGGQAYISIPTFTKNQQPHINEAPSVIPPPEEADSTTLSNKEEYRTSTVQVPDEYGANTPLTRSLNSSSLNSDNLRIHPAASASVLAGNEEKEKEPTAIEKQFEQFWLVYPRREGTKRGSKADALKVFRRLTASERKEALDTIGLYSQLEATKRENGKYIPDAERWLREKRFQTVGEEAAAEREKRSGAANGGNWRDNIQSSPVTTDGRRLLSIDEALAQSTQSKGA